MFIAAGFLGVISLLLMFAGFFGVYQRMKSRNDRLSKPFLLSSFVFVSVGTLYHNVFAVAAYTYNKLTAAGYDDAKQFALDLFNKFIFVGALAAVGYAALVILFFLSAVKGNIYPKKWMCIINPFVFMAICILLSKVLPQTPLVNAFSDLDSKAWDCSSCLRSCCLSAIQTTQPKQKKQVNNTKSLNSCYLTSFFCCLLLTSADLCSETLRLLTYPHHVLR